MKTLLCLFYLLPSLAFTKNTLTSLHFKPDTGQFHGRTTIDLLSGTTSVDLVNQKVDQSSKTFEQAFSYGFSNRLTFLFGFSFLIDQKLEQQGSTEKSSGLEEPQLGLVYRYLVENAPRHGNLDFHFMLSPKLGDEEGASTTKDGNAYRGASEVELGLSYSKNFQKNWEFQSKFEINYTSKATEIDLEDDRKSTTDSSIDFSFAAETQYYFQAKTYAYGSFGLTFLGDLDITDDAGVKTTSSFDPALDICVGVGHELLKNKLHLLIKILRSSLSADNSATNSALVLDADTKFTNITLGAEYLF